PRNVDAILVSQGFRDLVDDARGILTELLSGTSLELAQFTGAICPGDDETYRPGLWIVLRDKNSPPGRELSSHSRTRISLTAEELVKRLQVARSEEHTSELQSLRHLVCRLLLEKKKK